MTDIFFSYSSKDRERVRPVRDALTSQGFDVFWDQQVPAGVDWDTWIRQHLQRAKCAVVLWSENSVASDNVRHEATVAKAQGKLVPVLIEDLRPDQFPMGLYSVQGANLANWAGSVAAAEWQKLQAEVEARLTPLWVTRRMHDSEAALLAEKARRESIESRDRSLQEQLAREAQAHHQAVRERNAALDEAAALKSRENDWDARSRAQQEEIAGLERRLKEALTLQEEAEKEARRTASENKTLRAELERVTPVKSGYPVGGRGAAARQRRATESHDAIPLPRIQDLSTVAGAAGSSEVLEPKPAGPGWKVRLIAIAGLTLVISILLYAAK